MLIIVELYSFNCNTLVWRDVVFLAQLEALASFREIKLIVVSLSKTMVMIHNTSKKSLEDFSFFFKEVKLISL